MRYRAVFATAIGCVVIVLALAARLSTPGAVADTLPHELPDAAFWLMVSDFSEEGGSFRFQFMSNEREFPLVIPQLKQTTKPGGVYLGVGPEQNFSYIAALQPKAAFVFDIRHENMLEQLIYKAVFELSPTRVEFISRLFSLKTPAGISDKSPVRALFQAYSVARPDRQLFNQNLKAILDRLKTKHGFRLKDGDESDIAAVYQTFFEAGPGNAGANFGGRGLSYADLMTSTDDQGQPRSYLATEESYAFVRDLEGRNLVIPIVGDFAGPKAIRAVAQYLKEHQAIVSAFYTSNVEQYLFQQGDDWRRFYSNLSTLPVDAASTLVRSSHFEYTQGERSQQFGGSNYVMLRCPIADLVQAFNARRIQGYEDAIRMARR